MKVLSLFDGMACGMIAMQLAGVEIESYDAYEIDKRLNHHKRQTVPYQVERWLLHHPKADRS